MHQLRRLRDYRSTPFLYVSGEKTYESFFRGIWNVQDRSEMIQGKVHKIVSVQDRYIDVVLFVILAQPYLDSLKCG